METGGQHGLSRSSVLLYLALLALLAASLSVGYLLFHTLAEFFSVFIALLMFVTAWASFGFSRAHFLMFLACGYLWVAILDGVHALTYQGMRVLPSQEANTATQFWLAARYLEASVLLIAPMFARREVKRWPALLTYGALATALTISIFGGWFPRAYAPGSGLTPFKIASEYVVVGLLVLAFVHLTARREAVPSQTYGLLQGSIAITIAAELVFTVYDAVDSPTNALGHVLKVTSFGLVLRAVVLETVLKPFRQSEAETVARQHAQAALARSEQRYRQLFDLAEDGILVVDPESLGLLEVNPSGCAQLGREPEELLSMTLWDIHPSHSHDALRSGLAELDRNGRATYELDAVRKDRGVFAAEVSARRVKIAGKVVLQCLVRDVTRRNALEAQLRHAMKMEVVGRLASGIAHDFNNMLCVILSNLELLASEGPQRAESHEDLDNAMEAVLRAAKLSRRLLDLARADEQGSQVVDVNGLISGMTDLITRSTTGAIRVDVRLEPELWHTRISADAFEDVLLNLVLNARDAMPDGGTLTISTENAPRPGGDDGDGPQGHVVVTVSDTGTGMTPETAERVFEPFFTTKPKGKGTGLGMSMVRSFVERSGGEVQVATEVNKGTTVKLLLPRETDEAAPLEAASRREPTAPRRGHGELVLVVDDETELAGLTAMHLSKLGYDVRIAHSGSRALALLAEEPRISLMLADVVMPDMDGVRLAQAAQAQRPGLHILLTSGLDLDLAGRDAHARPWAQHLLRKPYGLVDLADAVHQALQSPADGTCRAG